MALPHVISYNNATFFARGKMWSVAADNPNYQEIVDYLTSGGNEEDHLIGLTSVAQLLVKAGQGRLSVVGGDLLLDGEILPATWLPSLASERGLIHALLARVGDKIRVSGDPEAPDGVYEVVDVDNTDPNQRCYLETSDGFFGYPSSLSIKEVYHEPG